MAKQTLHIEAIDTLFFRDGKPFSMGDEVWADAIFPPLPSVIYGALRSALMFQKGYSAEETINNTKNFKIHNIYLLAGNEASEYSPVFPFPYDLIKYKRQSPLFLALTNDTLSSSSFEKIFQAPKKDKAEDVHGKSFLERQYFRNYLRGKEDNIQDTSLSTYLIPEPKIGIGRDNFTRTTSGDAEGKMYRVGMQRLAMIDQKQFKNLHSLKIAVEFEEINLDNDGLIRLGGENKIVKYTTQSNEDINISFDNIHSNIIRVYFATPAVFENGWCPQIFLQTDFEGVSFNLLTCAVGKPIYAGGFDMKAQTPKYMFKAIPAGSVYYLKTNSVDDAKVLAKKLSDKGFIADEWKNGNDYSVQAKEFGKQGFGKIYVGINRQD